MARVVTVGDIYDVKIRFEDDPDNFKERPVVVIGIIDESPVVALATELTGTAPSDPPKYHDQFKVPIWNWRMAGLDKASYAKTHKLYEIPTSSLINYRGRMHPDDLEKIIDVINES